jgi:hypothetical protein
MVLLIHGAAGGWDEIAIAAVALLVLWAAVKLAGRKPATLADDDDEQAAELVATAEQEHSDSVEPTPTKLG